MQQNKYKIQALVEQGYDFSKLYPEKQAIVQEMTGANFSIPEIVDFIRSQTNNFQQENLVALDLDAAIYKLYVQQEGKKEEAPKEEAPKAPESPSGKVSKAVLETRLKIIKKQLQKDPSNSIFKTRKKIVEKLISQYVDGGSMKEEEEFEYSEGGGVGQISDMSFEEIVMTITEALKNKTFNKENNTYYFDIDTPSAHTIVWRDLGEQPKWNISYDTLKPKYVYCYIFRVDNKDYRFENIGEVLTFITSTKVIDKKDYMKGFNETNIYNGLSYAYDSLGKKRNSYAKGGNISDRTNYLPNRDIRAIVTDKGKVISGNDVVDGAYVKKRIKFEDGGEMMHFGQYPKGGETGKYTITLYFGGEQESEIYLNVTKEEAKELSMRAEHSVVEDAYGNIVEIFARGGKPKMIRTIFEEEEFEYGLGGIFGSQRSKAALMKDRAYKSEQPWEKNYKRKKAPKNPRYK